MLRSVRSFKPSQAFPRMLADFAVVHVCMMLALGIPVLFLLFRGQTDAAATRLEEALAYYAPYFLLLSLVFPLVFLLNGFYTHSRAYRGRYKIAVVLRGAGLGILTLLAVNYLFFRQNLAQRLALLLFAVLTMLALTSARLAKALVVDRYEIRLRNGKVADSEGTVLVLGGAGYIGSSLVRKLLDAGRKVRVVDSLVYGDEALRGVFGHPNLEMRVGDCRNIQDMVAAVHGIDSIIHLAAIVGDPACEQDRQTALEINYAATRMLIEVAKGHGVQRLVFASSCSVYGATDVMMDENSALQPISLYGQTKVDSEHALLHACSETFHTTILRLATVFGLSYRPRFDLVVNLLTAKAYNEGVITIFNGEQWRPFIHVHDVAEGFIRVLNAPLPVVSGQVFNLGDTRLNYTLTQLAQKILEMFPNTRVEHIENADRRNYRVSFEKIRSQLGFAASWQLEDGIRQLRQAFDDQEIVDYTDPRYYNQKFLKIAGSPSRKDVLDAHVMAAFANAPNGHDAPEAIVLTKAVGAGD
ncbi:MAG: NAD-dependent epimerase/dehydratase family protein [Acidobacteria bacterium]|nr:NAD-dependent epimerase/dehydratase family protein [Acidobacteriota bacterium]